MRCMIIVMVLLRTTVPVSLLLTVPTQTTMTSTAMRPARQSHACVSKLTKSVMNRACSSTLGYWQQSIFIFLWSLCLSLMLWIDQSASLTICLSSSQPRWMWPVHLWVWQSGGRMFRQLSIQYLKQQPAQRNMQRCSRSTFSICLCRTHNCTPFHLLHSTTE